MVASLRIAIDARCLNTPHLRGMGKYVFEMLAHADSLADIEWRLYGERFDAPFHVPALRRAAHETFDLSGYRFHTWEQWGLPSRALRGQRADLLHATATTLPWWQPVPTVVTLHDTLPWQATHETPFERWYWQKLMPAALNRCAAVITISDSSRRDIESLWPALAAKLTVIPHGIADAYIDVADADRPEVIRRVIGADAYVLYVGGAAEHKRFEWGLHTFSAVNDQRVHLVAVGFAEREINDARGRVPHSISRRVHFLPFVPEADMPQLYRHALATLYPTRYEGFGFPAVEAQAVGTPLLFSPVGSLAELVGPDSTTLAVDDLAAWQRCLIDHISTCSPPYLPSARARAWARQYSWSRSAEAHVRLYESLLPLGS